MRTDNQYNSICQSGLNICNPSELWENFSSYDSISETHSVCQQCSLKYILFLSVNIYIIFILVLMIQIAV